MDRVYELMRHKHGADAMYLALYDPVGQKLIFTYNVDRGRVEQGVVAPLGAGPTSTAIRENSPVILETTNDQIRFPFVNFGNKDEITPSQLHLPIQPMSPNWGDRRFGVISAQSYKPYAFEKAAISDLQNLGDIIATIHYLIDAEERLLAEVRQVTLQRKRSDEMLRHLSAQAMSLQIRCLSVQENMHLTDVERSSLLECVQLMRQVAALSIDRLDGQPTCPSAPGRSQLNLLSDRETQILRLLPLANKAIATQLSLSESTVRFHLKSLFEKLHVKNRTELATLASRWGLGD